MAISYFRRCWFPIQTTFFYIFRIWFMHVTSSIWTLIKESKKRFPGTISKWYEKTPFSLLFLVLVDQIHGFWVFVFTELYQKVRKSTEGQKLSPRPIWSILVGNDHFWAHITQRKISERFWGLLLPIGWWVTWYGHQHFLTTYCYGNFSRNLLNMHL